MFRHSTSDATLVGLAAAQGIATVALFALAGPLVGAGVFAVTMWWSSNTISHNHLHNPIFRSRPLNRAFSLYLSLLLGVPQRLWRARHLWHHAGEPAGRPLRLRGGQTWIEVALVLALWLALLALAPRFFLVTYLPGYAAGLLLCTLQGHYEHVGATAGISHYGAFYNRVWLNDGYHVEHHRWPGEHWSRLPSRRPMLSSSSQAAVVSPLPPVLRWAEQLTALLLGWLERGALASAWMQRFLVERHARAFAAVWPALLAARGGLAPARVGIVGGGLFPRTVLVLRRLAPSSRLVVVDASAANIERARAHLAAHGIVDGVDFVCARWDAAAEADPAEFALPCAEGEGEARGAFDLLVVPLAFVGDRDAVYRVAGGAPRLVHDWMWRRRGIAGAVVSPLLLKRVNLVA